MSMILLEQELKKQMLFLSGVLVAEQTYCDRCGKILENITQGCSNEKI